MFHEQLEQLLLQRRQTDLEIEKLINEHFAGRIRFSAKKFTGDLGELYFHQLAAPLFSRLEQSHNSNDDCDFNGVLLPQFASLFGLPTNEVRIEIKTRHDQEGNNHLIGLHTHKFDLLAFVALDGDFQCRHIGLIKASDITVDKQKRILYSNYYRKNLVVWKLNDWAEIPVRNKSRIVK